MLNPSRADATTDDHTIRKCLRYTQSWGYSGLVVVNLFAYISSEPCKLRLVSDPIGPENDEYLAKYLKVADRCLVAWGAVGDLPFMAERIRQVTPLLPAEALCLGYTKKGWPRHPSRAALDLPSLSPGSRLSTSFSTRVAFFSSRSVLPFARRSIAKVWNI